MQELPVTYDATRQALHRVAVHVVARARHAATGRFGLRATPGGFGTPAFGDPSEPEVLRVSGGLLLRERGKSLTALPLSGATLADAARIAGVDLSAPFEAGSDTPPVGDPEATLDVDPVAAAALGAWLAVGWAALDEVTGSLDPADVPAALQLWPEHFDAGTDVGVGGGTRTNLGVSPGDEWSAEPYLYVGPWDDRRPGDAAWWNAPFGAAARRSDVATVADAVAFFRRGLDLLSDRPTSGY